MRFLLPLLIASVSVLILVVAAANGSFDSPNAAEAVTESVTVRWGPYAVPAASGGTPGSTSNGLDFNVLKPCTDCYITSVTPNLINPDGSTVNITTGGMLHHMVLFDSNGTDVTCGNGGVGALGERILASGNERTAFSLPDGYGYYIGSGATENWMVLHEIMNMTPGVRDVYLEFEFTYRPGSDDVKPVRPVWLDVDNCAASEFSIPAGYSDVHWDWTVPAEGDVVSIAGHIHDAGISVSAEDVTLGQYVCTSIGGYAQGSTFAPLPVPPGDSGHPGSANVFDPGDASYAGQIEDMTGCAPMFRVYQGDVIRLHTQHNSPTAQSHVMGIMVAYIHVTTGPTPTPTPQATPTPTPTMQPEPGDSDGDGCSDEKEGGPDEMLGGQRDYMNPHDFYDVMGANLGPPDGIIDLPNDILGVILNYTGNAGYAPGDPATSGTPGTKDIYDRGPALPAVGGGPNPWNMTAPDGIIDLPNDILGVILQYDHDCR